MATLRIIVTLIVVTFLAAVSDHCEAAVPMIISQTGTGSYSISTTDLPEASGMDLTIKYDADYLEAPQVKAGMLVSNALMVPNTSTVGFIRIGIASGGAIKGSGELVSIAFTVKKKNAPVPILQPPSVYRTDFTQMAVDASASVSSTLSGGTADSGKNSTLENTSVNSGNVAAVTGSTAPAATVQSSAQVTSATGSLIPFQESGSARDDSRRETVRDDNFGSSVAAASPVEAAGGNTSAQSGLIPSAPAALAAPVVPAAKVKTAASTVKSSQSVLDRFYAYKGVRSLSKLSALFNDVLHATGMVQAPAVVVADGKSKVVMTIDLGKGTEAPSFSLKGANQKSLKRVAGGKWELEAVPRKGVFDVRLSVLLKGERVEIPLVVVPPLGQAFAREFDSLSETAVDALLAKPLKNNKPAYDLNADAKQDYIDDYILVGHWLVKKQRSANGSARKPVAAHK